MADRYEHWRRDDPDPVIEFSEFERRLFAVLGQEDYNYIYQLKLFLAEATEHIAQQLVPIYRRIVLAQAVSELLDLTTHPRLLVQYAASQKIDLIEGRPIRRERVILYPPRWPDSAWNHPRHRLRGIPGG